MYVLCTYPNHWMPNVLNKRIISKSLDYLLLFTISYSKVCLFGFSK